MAQTYTLVLEIGDTALEALTAMGTRLAIAKRTGNAPPNVVWLAWSPLARNTIAWDETYGLYAAELASRNGATIRIVSSIYPAAERTTYPFTGDAFGEQTSSRIPQRHYDVRNVAPFAATFGLLQDATVNGEAMRSPLNAVVVPPKFTADFTAVSTLYVWMQSNVGRGTIAPHVPIEATLVVFDPKNSVKRYRYDEGRRIFIATKHRPSRFTFFRRLCRVYSFRYA